MVLKNNFAEEQKMTLEEAILKSKVMSEELYLWFVDENVIAIDVPEGHTFGIIGVTWRPLAGTYKAAVDFPAVNGMGSIMQILNGDDRRFESLEALRNTFPKLFEVTGNFSPLC